MGKIGFVQVDGDYKDRNGIVKRFPNLALMRICSFYESKGFEIEWFKGMVFSDQYSKVYASKIFKFSVMPDLPDGTIIGGTGVDFENTLPPYIESQPLSYTLYPDIDFHVGMTMKGCRYRCSFCCVPTKEGKARFETYIDSLLINPNGGDRLMLLDNDFFGVTEWKANLIRIIELKLRVCFVQGLNIRIITKEQADLLSQCRYYNSKFNQRYLTFAWDRVIDRKLIMKGIETCVSAGIPANRMQFFTLIGYDTTPAQDLERVMFLKDVGCMPYAMPFNKSDPYQKAFARWVNHRATFKSCSWEDYKYRKEVSNGA
jgi:hypothetical protein